MENGRPPAWPEMICCSALRCSGEALSSKYMAATPLPSWIAAGHLAV
jgi:hypothetical protein